MEYTMGIDLGTSSVKAALLGRSGEMTEAVSKRYGIDILVLGWAEQDRRSGGLLQDPQCRRFCTPTGRRAAR